MTEGKPQGSSPHGENIGDEFVNLGRNLVSFLRAAWDSPDGQAIKEEVKTGLNELGNTLNKAAGEFSQGETGQKLKKDFEGLKERVASGELENRGREEMLAALRKMNEEITRAAERWNSGSRPGPKE